MSTDGLVEVRIHDMRLAARIGAHAHELDRRQMLRVSVVLRLRQWPADRLRETVDYGLIVEQAEALAERHIALIETFGLELAERCLAYDGVNRAEVIVEKPGALVNGIASTRIMLERPYDGECTASAR
ncbi:MAG: dihydroneopterin aldolase [Alphaproteobacteria bacterium]